MLNLSFLIRNVIIYNIIYKLDDTISTYHTWAMDKEWKQYKTEFFFPEGFAPHVS